MLREYWDICDIRMGWRQHFVRLLLMGAHTTRSAVESGGGLHFPGGLWLPRVFHCHFISSVLASVWRLVGSCFTADDDSEWNDGW